MIDTHCHLFKEYYDNLDEIIKNAKEAGVERIIVNGTNYDSNLEVLELSSNYDIISPALGFQPEEIDSNTIDNLDIITKNIDDIVAIGEIGLDYYNSLIPKEKQIDIFERQLALASKYNKPVIIHTRNAHEDTIRSLKKFPEVRGIIHCFSEGLKEAEEYINLGFLLGIGGIVTFKNADLAKVVKEIKLKNIVLETDSPYLAPMPLRGKRNEPSYLKYIVTKISEIKNIDEKKVIQITTSNVNRIFDF